MPNFYTHDGNEGIYFILPSDSLHKANLIFQIGRSNFSLPHEERNENQVYDRGKQFC